MLASLPASVATNTARCDALLLCRSSGSTEMSEALASQFFWYHALHPTMWQHSRTQSQYLHVTSDQPLLLATCTLLQLIHPTVS